MEQEKASETHHPRTEDILCLVPSLQTKDLDDETLKQLPDSDLARVYKALWPFAQRDFTQRYNINPGKGLRTLYTPVMQTSLFRKFFTLAWWQKTQPRILRSRLFLDFENPPPPPPSLQPKGVCFEGKKPCRSNATSPPAPHICDLVDFHRRR